MEGLSTKSKLHSRLSTFVAWIAPDPQTRDEIEAQADEIRGRIMEKAAKDGLEITSSMKSGSFAKRTGLRRHMRGNAEVEGQDVDISFVVKPQGEQSFELQPLVNKFMKYADESYPKTEKESTKSSVKLKFTNTLAYDLVPLFSTKEPEKQMLVRATGERILTSVQKHTDFVKSRTEESDKKKGVVLFNECVRIVKWWREFRCDEGNYLQEIPSIVIDLLCAKAFDQLSVKPTYAHTLAEWFTFLAHVVKKKEPVWFGKSKPNSTVVSTDSWQLLDPVNPENNIAKRFKPFEIDEFAEWLAIGRDTLSRSIAADMTGDDNRCLDQLVSLMGNPFKNHCDEEA